MSYTKEQTQHHEQIHRLVLEVLHDIGEKPVTFEGKKPGKKVLIIGGTHGNEVLGVLAVGLLKKAVEKGTIALKTGAFSVMLGNTKAIAMNERFVPGNQNLNRIYTKESLQKKSGATWEEKRAQKIAKVIDQHDIVIDLHATNNPSEPFVVAPTLTPENKEVYQWFTAGAVLEDHSRLLSKGAGTTDEYAEDAGKISVCYEAGKADDMGNLTSTYQALLNILAEQGVIEGGVFGAPVSSPEYSLVDAIPYTGGTFVFAEGKEENFAPIAKGEVIGYAKDEPTDDADGEPVVSPMDGVIIFPTKQKHLKTDGAVCYLAVPKDQK